MTICPGAFKLAGSTTRPSRETSRHTRSRVSRSRPITADIAPFPAGTASSMKFPRWCTMRTASAKFSEPAATKAEYSPRLCPATRSGTIPPSEKAVYSAMLVVSMAGWVYAVKRSFSSGPSKQSLDREKPRASSARAKISRASWCASARSRPIPTFCEPWPGNRNAVFPMFLSPPLSAHPSGVHRPLQHRRPPGQTAAEADEHQRVPLFDPSLVNRFIQGHRDGGRGHVSETVQVDDHLLLRQSEPLDGGVDDADVGLMGHEEVDVLLLHPRLGERLLRGIAHHADGKLENLPAGHGNGVEALVHRVPARRHAGSARGQLQQIPAGPVGTQLKGEKTASLLHRSQDDRSGSVAEEHAGVSVLPVGDF